MSKNIEDLSDDVKPKAWASVELLTEKGISHIVTSTLRTEAEQIALYAQGRDPILTVNQLRSTAGLDPIEPADNTYTVTNCDGVKIKSNHQGGRALDVVPIDSKGNPVWPAAEDSRWTQISEVFKSNGFSWGGDWPSFPDRPHYEMA